MSRDIQDRLNIFGCTAQVKRIALNMDQVDKYSPPPNPAKLTDSRSDGYIEKFGDDSWELDALEPSVIGTLITDEVMDVRDLKKWKKSFEAEKVMKTQLQKCSDHWEPEVTDLLDDIPNPPEEEEADEDDEDEDTDSKDD